MKNILLVLVSLLISSSSFARIGVVYKCTEFQKKKQYQHNLYLTYFGLVGKYGDIEEGENYTFNAEMYYASNDKPTLMTTFLVKREDVMVKFKSEKGSKTKVNGIIFLDEPAASWMTMNGKTYEYSCIQTSLDINNRR